MQREGAQRTGAEGKNIEQAAVGARDEEALQRGARPENGRPSMGWQARSLGLAMRGQGCQRERDEQRHAKIRPLVVELGFIGEGLRS